MPVFHNRPLPDNHPLKHGLIIAAPKPAQPSNGKSPEEPLDDIQKTIGEYFRLHSREIHGLPTTPTKKPSKS